MLKGNMNTLLLFIQCYHNNAKINIYQSTMQEKFLNFEDEDILE